MQYACKWLWSIPGSMWHFIAFLFQIFFYKVSKNKTSGSSTYLVLSTPLRLDKGDWVGQVTLCSFTFCSRTHKSFYKEPQNSLDYARGYVEIMCQVKSLWSKFHECSQVGVVWGGIRYCWWPETWSENDSVSALAEFGEVHWNWCLCRQTQQKH